MLSAPHDNITRFQATIIGAMLKAHAGSWLGLDYQYDGICTNKSRGRL